MLRSERDDKVKWSDSTSQIQQQFEHHWDCWNEHKQIQRPFKPHKRWLQSQMANAKRIVQELSYCHLLWHRVTIKRTEMANVYAKAIGADKRPRFHCIHIYEIN